MAAPDRIADEVEVVDPETAARAVEPEDTMFVSGFGGVGYPKLVPEAIAADGTDRELTVISGGGCGDEIDARLVESGDMVRRLPFQTRPTSRQAINAGELAFSDRHISRVADEVMYGGFVDDAVAVIEAVAVGPDWLIPSTSIGNSPAFVEAADRVIVEVNHAQPLALRAVHDVYRPEDPPHREPIPLDSPIGRIGSPRIEFDPDELVGVVETNRSDDPYEFRDPTDVDRTIAANLGDFLRDELEANPLFTDAINLQFGVGSMGNALMGALSDVDFGDRRVTYFGEVVQDGLLDMLDAGRLTGASATSLALSVEGQQQLFADVDRYAEDIVLRPGDISNNPALINRFGVVAVNSAVEVDIYGHANATHIGGTHVINGIGGGGDFSRNAQLSVIALPATAAGGDISKIVPMVPHVDHTEHDIDVIVTEHGVADLRGQSPRERAAAITACAHPDFREPLEDYREAAAKRGGNVPQDLATSLDWHVEWR